MAEDVQGNCAITTTRAIRPPPESHEIVSEFIRYNRIIMRHLFAPSLLFYHQ